LSCRTATSYRWFNPLKLNVVQTRLERYNPYRYTHSCVLWKFWIVNNRLFHLSSLDNPRFQLYKSTPTRHNQCQLCACV
jgi:hypothetical protein